MQFSERSFKRRGSAVPDAVMTLSVHNFPCHSFCILKAIPTKSKHTSSCSHAPSAKHRHSDVRTGGTHSYHCALSLVSNFCICVFQPVTLPALFMAQPRLSQLAQRRAQGRSKLASPVRTASYSKEYRRSVPAGRTDHPRSSSAEGKNVRSYTSTLSIRRHEVQRDFT